MQHTMCYVTNSLERKFTYNGHTVHVLVLVWVSCTMSYLHANFTILQCLCQFKCVSMLYIISFVILNGESYIHSASLYIWNVYYKFTVSS